MIIINIVINIEKDRQHCFDIYANLSNFFSQQIRLIDTIEVLFAGHNHYSHFVMKFYKL